MKKRYYVEFGENDELNEMFDTLQRAKNHISECFIDTYSSEGLFTASIYECKVIVEAERSVEFKDIVEEEKPYKPAPGEIDMSCQKVRAEKTPAAAEKTTRLDEGDSYEYITHGVEGTTL